MWLAVLRFWLLYYSHADVCRCAITGLNVQGLDQPS
jgi:hypothetical protein